jgi:hypothetical protein
MQSTPAVPRRPVVHLPDERLSATRRAWRDHGLSIVLVTLFAAAMIGQVATGWRVYNEERQQHGQKEVSFTAYLGTGHFGEATFENWESEFLQMAFYVLLTVVLFQRGSSESKRPGVVELVDLDPRESPSKASAPWPVRRGGLVLTLYENSLSLAFVLLFVMSFTLHATRGVIEYNEQQIAHGQQAIGAMEYLGTPQFWFESFQNWQSEFLSMVAMVGLSIFLRQRGSPESKPVDAPTWDTGG